MIRIAMRTTVTLDDDVVALVKRARKARKQSLREVVNAGLRQGLRPTMDQRPTVPSGPRAVFVTAEVSVGRCLIESIDDVSDLF